MRISRLVALLIVVSVIAGGTRLLTAQAPVTSVLGFAVDEMGKPMRGVPVTLVNEATGLKSAPIVSEPSGLYTFRGVQAGTYRVEAQLAGFTRPAVDLDVAAGDEYVVVPFLILRRGQLGPMREMPDPVVPLGRP